MGAFQNTSDFRVRKFVDSYISSLPNNVYGFDGSPATWGDLVWYIRDPDTNTRHRYLFTKPVNNLRRRHRDSAISNGKIPNSDLFPHYFDRLLKIYALYVQSESIVNNSRRLRITTASKVLAKALNYATLNSLPFQEWNSIKGSNLFWDYCLQMNLIRQSRRPVHSDRSRYAEDIDLRESRKSKQTPENLIAASGIIYNEVFKHVNDDYPASITLAGFPAIILAG